MFYGQPNRIWRGRIVKLVHGTQPQPMHGTPGTAHAAQGVTRGALFQALMSTTATDGDLAWLEGVLTALQSEGMLRLQDSNIVPAS